MPKIRRQVSLAPYTSFRVGGTAEHFVEVKNSEELLEALRNNTSSPVWLLSYGSNTLISDDGLQGLCICIRGGDFTFTDTQVTADAGVWWDDIVLASIEKGFWGIELLSAVPGSLGAALFINIAAYGQSIGSRVNWIDIWDSKTSSVVRLNDSDLKWGYKESIFQSSEHNSFIILRANLQLSSKPTEALTYQKAVDVAKELTLDANSLTDRRKIIIEARARADSIWDPNDENTPRSAGSFFRNPKVTPEQAEKVMSFDESGKTKAQIKKMNSVHGGDSYRVSAAHVMLAAGYKRGQSWGSVKLNDKNLLKIEALEGATAHAIYATMREIQATCLLKLGIHLEPEARLLGDFGD